MKNRIYRYIALALALCMVLPLAACNSGGAEETKASVDAADLFAALQQQVIFDTPVSDVGESAANFFPNLPEYALVTMYSGTGYYADELTWITVAAEADAEQALESIDVHLEQVHDQFLSYIPDEVDKIDNAQIWRDGVHIILCVSNDYKTAKAIMDDPEAAIAKLQTETTDPQLDSVTDPAPTDTTEVPTEETTEEPTEETTQEPTEAETTEPPKAITGTTGGIQCTGVRPDGFPELTSSSDTWAHYGAACIVDNMAFEYYYPSATAMAHYAELVSAVAKELKGETAVYDLLIPTAIGIVFPDNLAEEMGSSPQDQKIAEIFSMMDENVIQVNCFDNLMQHRDEYLYFRTDWHWNGPGAYYAYESFCDVKGITPYTMQQRKITEFDGYLGALYQNTCDKAPALAETPDTVIACHPYSENAYMYFTDSKGNRYSWNIISDVSEHGAEAKYYTYAGADQPFSEFYNPDVTDGSVAIVVKDSFGNVLMSYLVDHYSTIYEIDPRYWTGDLVAFAREKGADDIIFTHNLTMVGSDYLVGLLDKIIP